MNKITEEDLALNNDRSSQNMLSKQEKENDDYKSDECEYY